MYMTRCEKCQWLYPIDYVNILTLTEKGKTEQYNVCGICALELGNKMHGVNRKRFDGPIAEGMRKKALLWRVRHQQRGPNG